MRSRERDARNTLAGATSKTFPKETPVDAGAAGCGRLGDPAQYATATKPQPWRISHMMWLVGAIAFMTWLFVTVGAIRHHRRALSC